MASVWGEACDWCHSACSIHIAISWLIWQATCEYPGVHVQGIFVYPICKFEAYSITFLLGLEYRVCQEIPHFPRFHELKLSSLSSGGIFLLVLIFQQNTFVVFMFRNSRLIGLLPFFAWIRAFYSNHGITLVRIPVCQQLRPSSTCCLYLTTWNIRICTEMVVLHVFIFTLRKFRAYRLLFLVS